MVTTRDSNGRRAAALHTSKLTKQFGTHGPKVVDSVDMEVARGDIYGLLGPNGAGKSTTLRLIVGLLRPTSGTVEILGGSPQERRTSIGSIIEEPAFYPYLTGRQNLAIMADLSGVDHQAIGDRLATVGLADRADRPVGGYSTGMRQRLGIAAALLTDPKLLILDEPSAGLDPAGVAEVRGLLKDLGGGDRTVVISSHLLTEIDQICDRVGVISDGRLVYQGSIDELRHDDQSALMIRSEPSEKTRTALQGFEIQSEDGDPHLLVHAPPDQAPEIVRRLVDAGVEIYEVTEHVRSLEAAYFELTNS